MVAFDIQQFKPIEPKPQAQAALFTGISRAGRPGMNWEERKQTARERRAGRTGDPERHCGQRRALVVRGWVPGAHVFRAHSVSWSLSGKTLFHTYQHVMTFKK